MNNRFLPEQMLHRLGGWYLILLVALAQSVAFVGAIPGILSVWVSAELDATQVRTYAILLPILVVLTLIILLFVSVWLTGTARRKLDALRNPGIQLKPDDDFVAWREITGLAWRYGTAAAVVIYIVDILPVFLISFSRGEGLASALRPTSLSASGPIYVLVGGMVSLLGWVAVAVLLVERSTLPLRSLLLPRDFDVQLRGRSGLLLGRKILVLTLALISAAILLVAPLGFHQIVRALYSGAEPAEMLRALQMQSILFSILALALGAGCAYYLSKAVSGPIQDLIRTFNKIEQGDLKQRVPITATDELGIVAMQFNRMLVRLESFQGTLEQQVIERTKQLAATNEVGRAAASSLDPDRLLERVIPLFQEQFDYYFAAIYLLDPSGKWAELKEATGEAGRVLKQNHHRHEVMGRSMVGAAIRERSPRIAQVASQDKQRYENPLLPYTRSEVALPLMVGDRVLGALNVQSTREADFGPQVVDTMKNIASQLAIALENARLFQEAQQIIKEMRAVQQQYLLESWAGFSEENRNLEYQVGDEQDENAKRLDVSISLRDQTLGQIMLEGKEEWTPDQHTLVDAIATQAAIALENARLVSESRQIALRERMIAEINSKIWSSATIDGVLQTVVKELGRRLDASSATVELHIDTPAGEDK